MPTPPSLAFTSFHEKVNGYPQINSPLIQSETGQIASQWVNFFRQIWQNTQPYQVTLTTQSSYQVPPFTMGATSFEVYVNKSAGSPTQITLPTAPISGWEVLVKDAKGDADKNNITVLAPPPFKIDGGNSLVISASYGSASFIFNGAEYNLKVGGLGEMAFANFPPASPLLGSTGPAFSSINTDPLTIAIVAGVLKIIGSGQAGQLLRWDGTKFINVVLDPSLTLVGNVLGLTIGIGEELREDIGLDLREDSGLDLREDPPPTAPSPLMGYDGSNLVPLGLGPGLTIINGKLTTTGGWAVDENNTGELREDNDNELRE